MYNKSFYEDSGTAVWVGVPCAFLLIAAAWSVLSIRYSRVKTALQSVVELCFPRVFSKEVIVDQIELPTGKNHIVTSDVIHYRKQTCFEGRTMKDAFTKMRIYYTMFFLAAMIFGGVIAVFLWLLFLEVSHGCDFGDEFYKDCFLPDSPRNVAPLNCSSDAVNATTFVICYRMVFKFDVAAGVSYGLFNLTTFMYHIVAVISLQFVGSTCCCQGTRAKGFVNRLAILAVCYSPLIALFVVFPFVSLEDRINFTNKIPREAANQLIYVCVSTTYFVTAMPWERVLNTNCMQQLYVDPPEERVILYL